MYARLKPADVIALFSGGNLVSGQVSAELAGCANQVSGYRAADVAGERNIVTGQSAVDIAGYHNNVTASSAVDVAGCARCMRLHCMRVLRMR